MKLRVALSSFVLILPMLGLMAQTMPAANGTLAPTDVVPKVDGIVTKGEYPYSRTDGPMTVGASLGKDGMLYLYLSASSSGWLALGVGSEVMDKAHIFMGAIDSGTAKLTEQTGVGHKHSAADTNIASKWAMKSVSGTQVLEISLPYKAAVKDGMLNVIYAYAKTADLTRYHAGKGAIMLDFQSPDGTPQ